MNKKMKRLYDRWRFLMMPEVDDTGGAYCVKAKHGRDVAYFERKTDAKLFADSMNEKTKAKSYEIFAVEVDGFSTALNGNLENDFTRYWDMWIKWLNFAESVAKGGKLADGNRMMLAAYSAGLWFFRKAMLRIHKNQQEILKAIKELKKETENECYAEKMHQEG